MIIPKVYPEIYDDLVNNDYEIYSQEENNESPMSFYEANLRLWYKYGRDLDEEFAMLKREYIGKTNV